MSVSIDGSPFPSPQRRLGSNRPCRFVTAPAYWMPAPDQVRGRLFAGMTRSSGLSFARCSAVAAIAVLAAGCASQSAQVIEPEQPMVRQTARTAPADLQLLCANEAAQAFGMASETVLPIGSSSQGGVYTVILNAGGGQAICTIDDDGTILSLDRA
jgi:hypothetical protein